MNQTQSKTLNLILLVLILCVVAWLGLDFWHTYQPKPVRLQGQIEAQQYSISSKVAGRIEDVWVEKGDLVEVGQPIFAIHSPEVEAKLRQAQASQKAAGAMASAADEGAREQQIQAAKDTWMTAKSAAELAEKTYKRVNNLYKEGVVAEQTRDEAYTKWQATRYTEQAANQMYQLALAGSRNQTKEAAHAQEQVAAGAVAEVEAYADDLRIDSDYRGEVTSVLLQKGELAPEGFPVVNVIDMDDAWVVLHIREDRLLAFQKGKEFNATIPALGDTPYRFKVSYLSVMGSYATWRATDTEKDFDMRTFEVEARPIAPIQGLRAGMSVLIDMDSLSLPKE